MKWYVAFEVHVHLSFGNERVDLMTSWFVVGEAVLVGSVLRGGGEGGALWSNTHAYKNKNKKLSHTHLQTHFLVEARRRVGEVRGTRSTSSCSCRAGWRSGRRRSGRWLAELPSRARGCWRGWCRSTWPSCCWGREGRSRLFPRRRSCWRGGRPPRGGFWIMTAFKSLSGDVRGNNLVFPK